jgi:hypothetical protein
MLANGGEPVALVAEAIALQEQALPAKRMLHTSLSILDSIIGGFEAGKVSLVDSGSNFVFHMTSVLCVRHVFDTGGSAVFVDGGNSVDPYGMASLAKRFGMSRLYVLPRIHIARAFTTYQLATLILDVIEKKIEETGAGLLVLACLPNLFLDEDVDYDEAHQLFMRSLRKIKEVTEKYETVTLVTNAGLSKMNRRKKLRKALYESVDKVVRLQHHRRGLEIVVPEKGIKEVFRPVPLNQATIDDFADSQVRIATVDLDVSLGELKENTGRLRVPW